MHMLGADEVGFGTQALIAEGCVMAGVCETNNCPAGVATQDEELRKKFTGQPEHVINFMMFMAQEKREILFAIGANRISEIVGRTDLLEQVDFPNRLDLSELIVPPPKDKVFRLAPNISRYQVPDTLDQRVPWENGFTLPQLFERIRADDPIIHWGSINNTDRTVGAWLAGHLVREFGEEGFSPSQFILKLKGSAGQSLGFGAIRGMEINVTGDANDYVGKALSGGRIIVKPHNVERGRKNQAIIGNTALYGATSGKLFAAGMAGERFAVRNSGGKAVIEGCGNNGCEYMTGGRVIVLGPVGSNFAAGMSGGVAFVHDPEQTFERKLNPGTAISFRVTNPNWQAKLKEAIIEHFCKTESPVAEEILTDWQSELDNFHMVVGKDMLPRYPEKDQPLWNGEQLNAA
jgi:glutamate synthase (NADPH/NADH) large chain